MDFFHCNNCYIQPGPHKNKSFWLTSCGHSLCEDCSNTSDSICKMCHKNCKYLALNKDMPDDVKSYFSDSIKDLKKILKVLLIQNKHCKIYIEEYVPKLEAKYYAAKLMIEKRKSEIQTAKITIEAKNSEIDTLKTMIKKLEEEIQDIKKQFCSLTQNSSNISTIPNSLPIRYSSMQGGTLTPKSGTNRLSGQSRLGNETFLSPPISSPFHDKKRLTPMDILLKSKNSSMRGSPTGSIIKTPTSNQTFRMTVNSSPESSSEDEGWTNRRKSTPLIPNSHHYQKTPTRMRGRFF